MKNLKEYNIDVIAGNSLNCGDLKTEILGIVKATNQKEAQQKAIKKWKGLKIGNFGTSLKK